MGQEKKILFHRKKKVYLANEFVLNLANLRFKVKKTHTRSPLNCAKKNMRIKQEQNIGKEDHKNPWQQHRDHNYPFSFFSYPLSEAIHEKQRVKQEIRLSPIFGIA